MPLLLLPASMDAHTVMEEWEVSSFDGGFEGLRDLTSRRFSGAVEAGDSWLFFRDGEPLAAVDDLEVDPRPGDVDAFEGASGRTHEATRPATAALAAMLALDGEVRGQYFTEDTPLSTVHDTLSEGGFTGYVELSENVLSGDYYVVYEDGAEDYLGVLGSSQRLITDDEAQSKAEGEVGIYSVVAVSLPDVEIPEPESAPADAASETVAAGPAAAASEMTESSGLEDPLDQSEAESEPEPMPAADDDAGAEPESDVDAEANVEPEPDVDETPTEDPENDDEGAIPIPEESEPEPDQEAEAGSTAEPESDPARTPGPDSEPEPEPEPEAEPRSEPTPEPDDPVPQGRSEYSGSDAGDGSSATRTGNSGSSEPELSGVTTRSVPSLDPERTGRAAPDEPKSYIQEPASRDAGTRESNSRSESDAGAGAQREPEPVDEDRLEAVREETRREVSQEYENRIEELQSELQSVREERDRLQQRVSKLESANSDGTASAGPMLSPSEALAGTSLFVREGTRGEATLEDAHAGRADRETLAKNLRIEFHTQFDDEDATVDGEPFESWLRSSAPHEFVEWLIEDLLFEIQTTGAGAGLRHLYDAIPEIDRIGFDDAVTVGDGEEGREITFDVVARNRMGEPLIVADIDESRDPTRAESIRPLIGDAEDVSMEHDTLAATFSVTSSFFEPDALDAAREATSGSLLGRDKYRSYVKLARKNGFHLCMVESREESFHLAVPEL